MDHRQPAWYNL